MKTACYALSKHGVLFRVTSPVTPQKIFSALRKVPSDPTFAIRNTTKYWFSFRIVPNENLRYSKPNPQHEPL
jgi:hypothetical protein